MQDHVLTLNAGSSSVKFALFSAAAGWPRLVASGQIEGLGTRPGFIARTVQGDEARAPIAPRATHDTAIGAILEWVEKWRPDNWRPKPRLAAIGHRIVHGGLARAAPVALDDPLVEELRALAPLAPLHQPHNLAGVEAARAAYPNVPQIACFDTAFHRGHDFTQQAYALPRVYYERGLRRFGFHGLSYEFIARRLNDIDPVLAAGRVIVAHLGAGASLCALREGRSIATTMGFSALDGLPMGTRCGQIDPGLVLHLLAHDGMSAADVAKLLYERSGLEGLSGISRDMRVLEASSDPAAQQAIDYFITRLRMEIGAMTAALSGLDALVFTAGVGEHSASLRGKVLAELGWLGLTLDEDANARHALVISRPGAAPKALVVPTDEEAMIALHAIETAGISRTAPP
jgi:acetate kinase